MAARLRLKALKGFFPQRRSVIGYWLLGIGRAHGAPRTERTEPKPRCIGSECVMPIGGSPGRGLPGLQWKLM
jgi:hypothetical protein